MPAASGTPSIAPGHWKAEPFGRDEPEWKAVIDDASTFMDFDAASAAWAELS